MGGKKIFKICTEEKGGYKEGRDKIDLCRARMKVALLKPGRYEEVIQKDNQ